MKLICCSFFSNQKLVATTTNLFINGCSLHGSHQVIILASKNSDKSCDWLVTNLISSPWSFWLLVSGMVAK